MSGKSPAQMRASLPAEPARGVATLLALALSPFLAFLHLRAPGMALRYLLANILVLGLGGLFAFLGYGLASTGVVLFCNFALVNGPGTAHLGSYALDRHFRGPAPLYSTLPFLFSLPVLITLVLYALSNWFELKRMENAAMEPTLAQDAAYLLDHVHYHWWPPQRGDIVAFRSPGAPADTYRISRIIGLPQDRVAISRGVPRLNGRELDRQRLPDIEEKDGVTISATPAYREALPEGAAYLVLKSTPDGAGTFDHRPEVVVLPETFFVMSDNRDQAHDSRDGLKIGLVKRKDILAYVIPLGITENERTQISATTDWLLWRIGLKNKVTPGP